MTCYKVLFILTYHLRCVFLQPETQNPPKVGNINKKLNLNCVSNDLRLLILHMTNWIGIRRSDQDFQEVRRKRIFKDSRRNGKFQKYVRLYVDRYYEKLHIRILLNVNFLSFISIQIVGLTRKTRLEPVVLKIRFFSKTGHLSILS